MARDAGETFDELLRRYRSEAGLTQEDLAERSAVSARTVSDIERGLRKAVYRHTARRLADALGLKGAEQLAFERAGRSRVHRDQAKPAAPEIDGLRSGIPTPLTRLIGRDEELAGVMASLRNPEVRVLTLVGPGGIGKTRLAIEIARQIQGEFRDGVFFVPLAVTNDPAVVPSLIARELQLLAVRKPVPEALRDHLRDREVLLVLDTFEHVLPAAAFVAQLAVACPRLTFLVTSRAPLRVRGEHDVPLGPLRVPDVGVADLDRYPATALFVERVQAGKLDLVAVDKRAAAIVEICRRLEGLPLALELAAVRLRHLPLATVQQQLDNRLNLLVGGPRDLPPRHQTMRDTIAWSYDLLEPHEQLLFRQLSVFAGGWTPASAESVCMTDSNALVRDLSVLVDNNLIAVDRAARDEPRFGMLDVIREFATEQAEANGEANELARRHATVYTEFAETAEPELLQSGQEAWYRRLQVEQDNLRAALGWAFDRDVVLAQRLAGALWLFWRRHGDYPEARLSLDRALAADSAFRPKVLWGAAWISYYQGDYAHARQVGDELLLLAQAHNDPIGLRNGLTVQGIVLMAEQRFADALAPLEEAIRICREVCPQWLLATSLLNLGIATLHGSGLARSRRLARSGTLLAEALAGYRQLGDQLFVARTTGYLGYVALLRGDQQTARRRFAASLKGFRELGERFGIAEALQAMAVLAAAQGKDERAAELAGAANALWASMSAQALASDRAIASPYLDAARRRIGASGWRSAWRRGKTTSLDQAVTHALRKQGAGSASDL